MDVLGANTTRQQADNGWERARRWALGERWTPEMVAANEHAVKELAHARKRLADHARALLGHEAVELFLIPEPHEGQSGPDRQTAALNGNPAETKTAR